MLEDGQHAGVALQPGDLGGVGPIDVDAGRRQFDHRALQDGSLAEAGQHVGDVLEEGAVGPDDQHPVAGEPAPVLEQEVRGAVQADGRLAGAGPALDDQAAVERGADDDVLLGLDGGDDLAHRAGPGGADLGQHRIGDAAGAVVGVGVVEVLVEIRRDLGDAVAVGLVTSPQREAAAEAETERVGTVAR